MGDSKKHISAVLQGSGCLLVTALTLCLTGNVRASGTNAEATRLERWFHYTNEVIDDIPWSIHIVKLDRSSHDFEFTTTLGRGEVFGMGTVSEQLKTLSRDQGQPMAAINGDFYDKSEKYQGRPRDLQIRRGEVVSNPSGHTCFWMGLDGTPQMTN